MFSTSIRRKVSPADESLLSRRQFLAGLIGLGALALSPDAFATIVRTGSVPLRLYNAHTRERCDVHLFLGRGTWNPRALAICDWLVRDHRESVARRMDPRLYAALYLLQRAAGPGAMVTVLSGFRTRKTNEMLRRLRGAAPNSYHMRAQAIDFRIEGISPRQIARSVHALGLGGTGLYPTFVHIDSGPRRRWGMEF